MFRTSFILIMAGYQSMGCIHGKVQPNPTLNSSTMPSSESGKVGADKKSLSKECKQSIRNMAKDKSGEVRFCFNQRLKENPKLSGRVVISMSITSSGEANKVQISNNSTGDEELSSCIISKAQLWKFTANCPDPNVSFTFQLHPGK